MFLKIKPLKIRSLPRNRLSPNYQQAIKRAVADAKRHEWRKKQDRRPLIQGNFICRIETYAIEDVLDLFGISFGWETCYDCLGGEYRKRIDKIARLIPKRGQWPYVSTWAKDMKELLNDGGECIAHGDGFHRVLAARKLGLASVDVIFFEAAPDNRTKGTRRKGP
jgi:hypothetical protein